MSVTGKYRVKDLITDALRKAGVTAHDEAASADQIATGRAELDRIMKGWQVREEFDFMRASMSVAATTSAIYTLSPERPIRIESARWKDVSGNEVWMTSMTRQEYDALPNKDSTGIPTQYHYDRQAEDARLLVWPVATLTASRTLEITYQREFADVRLGDEVGLPGEWWNAAVLTLAAELADTFGTTRPNLQIKAQMAERDVLAGQSYGSVFFGCD